MIKFGVISGEVKTKVTTDALALRSKAQTQNGKRFFYIPKGRTIKVVQEAISKADGYTWDCVIVEYGGKEYIGYAAAEFLK